MLTNDYRRYTANGYPHPKLKDQVRALIKTERLSRSQAQKKIADKIEYPSWSAIMDEPMDIGRDIFLRDGFANKTYYQSKFDDFLKGNNLEDTLANYRRFLVDRAKIIGALRKTDTYLLRSRKSTQEALLELNSNFQKIGLDAFLPENYSDYLLHLILGYLETFLSKPHTMRKILKNPHSFKNDKNREYIEVIQFVMDKVLTLKTIISHPNGISQDTTYSLSLDDLVDGIQIYCLRMTMESISRTSHLSFSKPSIETFFNRDTVIELTFSEQAIKILDDE